ncbi:DUF397 domain-containing protein [Streptomyces sp. NBRC 110028]|uniref:DUF397 domain-containing protein n=1 Tax=Streptomyces sp. NBRC 110028 TaxID=1621260 RepID=UPI0006E3AA2B|nr:DUF397 domain-containing protein [Streptomyces sp. NBRC 110028]
MAGLAWRKSSFSSGVGGQDCVEVADAPQRVILLRESDDPGVVIATDPDRWAAFVRGAKQGTFDHLA